MKILSIFFILISVNVNATPLTPESFNTKAELSVDQKTNVLTSAIGIIEPRLGAAGYSWIKVYFYSFKPELEDLGQINKGSLKSMNSKWNKLSSDPVKYNHSQGILQLSVDKNFKIWQVDMSIPGHSCTIMTSDTEAAKGIQNFKFDGKRLQLQSKGSFICDMKFMKIPNQTFNWKIDLDIPVLGVTQ